MKARKLLGSDVLEIRRIRLTPVRNRLFVYSYNRAKTFIATQSFGDYWKSKRNNTSRFHRKYGYGPDKCILVDCECKEIW